VTLRILVVDDEAVARRRIRRLLEREPDVTSIDEASNGSDALESMQRDPPDLVFLDVQMPEFDGFELLAKLPEDCLPRVIFVTAYDRYALRAFDVHAIDYLLKPFSASRLQLALERARERIRTQQVDRGLAGLVASMRARPAYLSRISVKTGGRIVLVDIRAVDWMEADDNYVRLHCGTREYAVRESLSALERQLDPDVFIRIHRSVLVRIDRIREFQPATHGDMDVILRDGTQLTLSRTWRAHARHLIGE
jgi:two-component system, LytTR family, response regulator